MSVDIDLQHDLSFLIDHIKIVRIWDFQRNDFSPLYLGPEHYNEIIHLKCFFEHEWIDTLDGAIKENYLCPYCSGKRAAEASLMNQEIQQSN